MADENVNCFTRIGRMFFSKGIVMRCVSLGSVFLGIGVGVLLKFRGPLTLDDEIYLRIPTALVMRTLSAMVSLLIMSNVIIGFSRSNMTSSRKINFRAMTYFVLSTILSILFGLLLVCLVQPGAGLKVTESKEDDDDEAFSTIYSISDLFMNIFPRNILSLGFEKFKTVRVMVQPEANSQKESILTEATQVQVEGKYVNDHNILGLFLVSFITGMALRSIGEEGVLFVDQVIFLNKLFKSVLKMLMCFFPFGVGSLIVRFICEVEYSLDMLVSLGKFIAIVIGGLVFHSAVVLPLIYLVCTGQNPFHVIRGTSSAFLRVLLLSSSDLVTKLHICCEEVIMIDTRITRFMMPIGLNFNLNGTAFYEMVVVVYVVQLNSLTVDWTFVFTIGVAVMLTAVGEAGVPGTGTMTTLFILSATGVLETNAALPLVVEWLLYLFTPVVNVLGNCFGMALVYHLSKEDLENMDEQEYSSAVSNASNS